MKILNQKYYFFFFFVSLWASVSNALIPPWWITDNNKTWPKSFWIGAKFNNENSEFIKLIKKMVRPLKDNSEMNIFKFPRITLVQGNVETADAIRSIYHLLENLSWKKSNHRLFIKKLFVRKGIIGLEIALSQLPEFQKLRKEMLFNLVKPEIKDLEFIVPHHNFVLEIGTVKQSKSLELPENLEFDMNISFRMNIAQIEYLVLPQFEPNTKKPLTENQRNEPMYQSALYYAKGVEPIKKVVTRPGQRIIQDVINTIK